MLSYYWTLASASYDYPACTRPLREVFLDGRRWRLVEIRREPGRNTGWADTQVDRYASGCNATIDAKDAKACAVLRLVPLPAGYAAPVAPEDDRPVYDDECEEEG